MRFLTRDQGEEWLAASGLPALDESERSWEFGLEAQYGLPTDAGRKTALARLLVAPIDDNKLRGMLWITAHGIWPSSENVELFYAIRRGFGESRRLSEIPCHVFDHTAAVAAECLLDVTLYFSWDARLYLPNSATIIKFSHDEILEVHSKTAIECATLIEGLKRFGLRMV